LIGEYVDSKHKIKIRHKSCGSVFSIYYKEFRNKKECPFCKKEKDKIIYNEFIKSKVEEKGYTLLSAYNNAVSKLDMVCPNGHFIKKAWYHLKEDTGCPICANQNVVKGINDISTTHTQYLKYFNNTEDAYLYSYGSNKEIVVKCPDCGNLKKIKISDLIGNNFYCRKCGDGVSYPEKIMFNVLSQLNINFETQKKFCWSENKYYDFYIPSLNIIIETHGEQHYKESNFFKKTLKEQENNDFLKKYLATQNGIEINNYIVIDCRNSNIDWIKNNILNSKLHKIYNFSNIDWTKCHEHACNSLVKLACDLWKDGNKALKISELLKICKSTAIRYLKKGVLLNWCDYNPKKETILAVSTNGKNNGKKVISLTTGIIYKSAADAGRIFGTQSNISHACKYTSKTAYKQKWMYYDDFINKHNIKPRED